MPESLVTSDGRLRLEFVQTADRVSHRLFAGDTLVLESQEGTSADAWPASPPLQSLLIEPRGEGSAVALLVGMAGKSHWSASIEPRDGGFHCDIACRLSDAAGFLGTTYRVLDPRVTIEPVAPATRVRDSNIVRITPPTDAAVGKHTVRWRYDVRIA